MEPIYQFLLSLGGILLLGMATDMLGRHTFLPRVTLLLIFGVVIGQEGLDLLPGVFTDKFDIVTDMALLMVGFLLGEEFTPKSLRRSGRTILWISISGAIITAIIVALALILVGVTFEMAILLGCIASATAPAAIVDVVLESETKSRFANLLLSIVAIDDAWGLVLFSFGMAVVSATTGYTGETSALLFALTDIGGSVLLGLLIGLPAAFLTGRIRKGQPLLVEALGFIFLCGGLAVKFNVSFLIASMVMGAVVANLAKHHTYPFHAIEGIEWPFMIIFFILAGASLELKALLSIGAIGIMYIISRTIGKIFGAWVGAKFARADKVTRRWIGIAMLTQAGVPVGMAMVASNMFPEYRQILLTVIISSTVIFEISGPVLARTAIRVAMKNKTNHL